MHNGEVWVPWEACRSGQPAWDHPAISVASGAKINHSIHPVYSALDHDPKRLDRDDLRRRFVKISARIMPLRIKHTLTRDHPVVDGVLYGNTKERTITAAQGIRQPKSGNTIRIQGQAADSTLDALFVRQRVIACTE